jgi:plastocyanin
MGLRPFSRHHHLLWITVLVLLASGTLLLAACGGASDTGASTPTATQQGSTPTQPGSTPTLPASIGGNTVTMVENGTYAFSPAILTVPKGTTVTWTNKSDAPHTVTSDNNAFTGSSNLSENQTFQMTFTTAGTFTYHCAIHSYMKATIIVTP